MASKTKNGGSAKDRVAAMRAVEKRKERLRWLVTLSVVGVIILLLAGGALWAVNKSDDEKAEKETKTTAARLAAGPPWSLPADPTKAAKEMGLDVKGNMQEGNVNHFHLHVSVFVNGKAVPIPESLGISAAGDISELHTHDTRGVIHIESFHPDKTYTLDQVFREWEVPLDAGTIGQFKTDATHTLKIYVDGKEVGTDPTKVPLLKHQEVAVVYGTAADKVEVPATFKFEEGE
ncbi:MAG: hypothetical protein ABIS86_16400 [Streptosporangiaceae bacterium]